MKKILLQATLFILSPFCVAFISAQSLSINHTLEGDMANEITQALTNTSQVASQIQDLTIVSDNANLNYSDFIAIKSSFSASLKKADISAATFVNNRLPSNGAWDVNGAFTAMKQLQEVVLPDDLVSLGGGAFNGCSALSSVNLPTTLRNIESYVFKNCIKIKFEELPDAVTQIYQEAFNGCTLLALTKLPASLKKVEKQAFLNCKAITASDLPESLEVIGDEAFNDCSNVSFSAFPVTITSIGQKAFRNTKVAFTEWPASLPIVPTGVFANVSTIVDFSFPATVTSIAATSLYVAESLNIERTFTSRALTPPSVDDASAYNTFGHGYGKMNLYVLRSGKAAYSSQVPWSKMNIEVISYPLTIAIFGDGEVTTNYDFSEIKEGLINIAELDDISFNLTSSNNQTLSKVSLDNVDITDQVESGVLSLSNITSAHTLEVVFGTFTSIESSNVDKVSIYPNPTQDVVHVSGSKGEAKSLFNVSGKLLLNTVQDVIDVSSFESGIYLLKVNNKIFKIVKR